MPKKKIILWLVNGTLLSIPLFFAVSFLSILFQMPPFQYQRFPKYIGLPFSYYDQYWTSDTCMPLSGWNITHLAYDCLLTWILVSGVYWLIKTRVRKNKY